MQLLNGSVTKNQNGSILIAIVVTMVMVSVLAAGLLSINSTASFNQTGSNSSSNAFHLAEAGYRYVLSHVSDYATIHDQTFTLDTGNRFTITLKPYDFDITGVSGTQIQTLIPYGNVPFSNITVPGTITVGGTVHAYSTIDVTESAVNFNTSSGGLLPTSGTVQLAALTSGSPTITENSTFTVKEPNSLNLFPENNGTFTVGANQYRYRSKTATTLIGITSADGPWPGNPVLNDADPVILDSFIELESTGNYGSGSMSSQRLLTYHIPLDSGSGSEEEIEEFPDLDNWSPNTGSESTGEGEFGVGDVDGNDVLIITDTTNITGYLDTTSINYDWQNNGPDLHEVWDSATNYLSYNVQVKVYIGEPDPSTYEPAFQNMSDNFFYMIGINFRKQANGDSYGLSFFRAEPDNRDGIPDDFNPMGGGGGNGGQAMVLLWERIGSFGNWRWLAYANVSDVNLMRNTVTVFEDDFESGLGNWVQSVPDTFNFEAITSHDGTSPNQTITDSVGGNYQSNNTYIITSNAITITGFSSLSLSFWHKYNTGWGDRCRVEVSLDNGAWQTLNTYQGNQNSWEQIFFGLDSYLPADSIQIRFSLNTNGWQNRNGWNIDDVKIEALSPKWMTLMLHLEEKDVTGTKTNEIKAYIGDETVRGTANNIAQDNNRLNNTIGEGNWPPNNVDDTNSTNDYFTLIRWDGINTNVALSGIGNELESIISVSTLTSPPAAYGTFDLPEIGLHSWGWNYNVTYFDDFSIQTN